MTCIEPRGYAYTEMAYILDTKDQKAAIEMEFNASKNNPLYNLAIVVNNWGGEEARLSLSDKEVAKEKDFRTGIEYDVEGNMKFIVWIKHKAQ